MHMGRVAQRQGHRLRQGPPLSYADLVGGDEASQSCRPSSTQLSYIGEVFSAVGEGYVMTAVSVTALRGTAQTSLPSWIKEMFVFS